LPRGTKPRLPVSSKKEVSSEKTRNAMPASAVAVPAEWITTVIFNDF
jgi:hypothetical protein